MEGFDLKGILEAPKDDFFNETLNRLIGRMATNHEFGKHWASIVFTASFGSPEFTQMNETIAGVGDYMRQRGIETNEEAYQVLPISNSKEALEEREGHHRRQLTVFWLDGKEQYAQLYKLGNFDSVAMSTDMRRQLGL